MALAEYGNAFNIDTDGNGNPVLIDPQSDDIIATYDRDAGTWVFDSVSTEDTTNTKSQTVDRGDVSAGKVLTQYSFDNVFDANDKVRGKTSVGTSSSEIAVSEAGSRSASMCLVTGVNESDNDIAFVDIIVFGRPFSSVDVVSTLNGGASGRSYSSGSFDDTLQLAMDSGTYEVSVRQIAGFGL